MIEIAITAVIGLLAVGACIAVTSSDPNKWPDSELISSEDERGAETKS